eukprot:121152-Alexandrium_andersonii.AAC.1
MATTTLDMQGWIDLEYRLQHTFLRSNQQIRKPVLQDRVEPTLQQQAHDLPAARYGVAHVVHVVHHPHQHVQVGEFLPEEGLPVGLHVLVEDHGLPPMAPHGDPDVGVLHGGALKTFALAHRRMHGAVRPCNVQMGAAHRAQSAGVAGARGLYLDLALADGFPQGGVRSP